MPLQNYGAIMGSMADTVSQPVNSLLAYRDRQQVLQQRDEELRQREAVRNQLIQQQQQEQAQQEGHQQALAAYGMAMQGDPNARAWILKKAASMAPPELQQPLSQLDPVRDWDRVAPAIGEALGVKPQEADQGVKIGQYNPGDYTPQTWAQFLQTKDPSGLQRQYAPPAPPNMTVVQLPTGQALLNPRTGQTSQLSTRDAQNQAVASEAQARAQGAAQGAQQAAGQANLPTSLANAQDMRNVLNQLKTAPGLRYIVGAYSLTPGGAVPGTPQADALALWEQIQGKAFLQAFDTLKGGGQITEVEGKKATSAITRLANRQQSLGGFMNAIKDLESVVSAAENRARAKAGQQRAAPAPTAPAQSGVVDFNSLPE